MIEAEKANYTVSRMCGMLEVSRAGSTNAASPAKAGRRNSGVPSWTPRSLTSIRLRRRLRCPAHLGRSAIGRIWRRFELKPHLVDGFKLSNDPLSCTTSSMLLACSTIRRRKPWCCVDEKGGCRPWTAPSRRRRRCPGCPNGAATTTPSRGHQLFTAFDITD